MLGFAKMLWQGSKSKSATEMECDLFVLDGQNWQSLTDAKCTVTFENDGKKAHSLKFACPDESFIESMRLDNITNLSRFEDVDTGSPCFQWIVRKGKNADNMEEFGARFSDQAQADVFIRSITAMGQQSADVVFESTAESTIALVEKLDSGEWEVIEDTVSVLISQSKNGDNYLTVQKLKPNPDPAADILFHSMVSPALQIELSDSLVTFLGFTPLSQDIRVLGLRIDECPDFVKALNTLGVVSRPRPKAPRVSQSVWDEEPEDEPLSAIARRRRRVSDQVVNLHMQTSRLETDHKAIVFSAQKQNIGFEVFDTSKAGSRLKAVASFTQILPPSKNLSSVMIHEGDKKILMLGKNSVVSELDLERGKIVNEYNTDEVRKINTILPVSKSAQSSHEKTFFGMNEKSIFVMDPRISAAPAYTYSSNVKLSAAATDDAGHIVIANKLGQFRLFDGQTNRDDQLKRAKSLLSGVGDPIHHVDVTGDGKWILGTAATYLVLINVCDGDTSGFEKSVSKTAEPIVLSLDPDDIAKYKLSSLLFTAARFDESEKKIISSTGSLAIVWDFASIKKSNLISYSIKLMKDYIIETAGGGQSVVAMYSDKIEVARVRK